jgi:hypothetical protein
MANTWREIIYKTIRIISKEGRKENDKQNPILDNEEGPHHGVILVLKNVAMESKFSRKKKYYMKR